MNVTAAPCPLRLLRQSPLTSEASSPQGPPFAALEKPLFTYSEDEKPGDIWNDGVGGIWGVMWTPALRETAEKIPQHVETLSKRSPLGRLAEPKKSPKRLFGSAPRQPHTLLATPWLQTVERCLDAAKLLIGSLFLRRPVRMWQGQAPV